MVSRMAYVNGTPGDSTGDDDRMTEYTYNAIGVTSQTAYLADGDQTTWYDYAGDDSPVPSHSQLMSVEYPQGSTGSNTVSMTYNADGSLATRTDQRGVMLTYAYDNAGHRLSQEVSGAAVDGDKKVKYGYTDLGQPDTITTYSNDTATSSKVSYDYNGFGQLSSEDLGLDEAGSLGHKTINYGYTDTSASVSRLTSLTYPHTGSTGRVVNYGYGHSNSSWSSQTAIDDALSRIGQIMDANNTILAEYAFNGLNQVIGRDDPSHRFAMRIKDPAAGIGPDAFGRISGIEHVTYDSGANFTSGSATIQAGSTYGYDLAGNRIFDKPSKMPEHARMYTYDGLNRLTDSQTGVLNDTATALYGAPYGSPRTQDMQYDLLGNFESLQTNQNVETRQHNDANEIISRTASTVNPGANTYVGGFGNALSAWQPQPTGSFSISSGVATATGVDNSAVPWGTGKAMLVTDKIANVTDLHCTFGFTVPSQGTSYAGVVFGYQDADNFWAYVGEYPYQLYGSTYICFQLYQVSGGTWTAEGNPRLANAATSYTVTVQGSGFIDPGGMPYSFSQPIAAGRVGVIASRADVAFGTFNVSRIDWASPATPAWQVYNGNFSVGTGSVTLADGAADLMALAVREGTYSGDCDIEVQLDSGPTAMAFNVQDSLNYYRIDMHYDPQEPGCHAELYQVIDGKLQYVALLFDSDLGQFLGQTESAHLHVKLRGRDMGIWLQDGSNWICFYDPDITNEGKNRLATPAAGSVGLATLCWGAGCATTCRLLKVGTITGGGHTLTDSQTAVNETFSTSVTPAYDAAGNLTNDGIYRYSYDAWNRLVKVMRQGPTASPQVIATYRYDGLGHRIEKVITNSGDKNRTEYFYYNAKWQLLEIADSGNKAKQQFVWGTQYIDEAICMDVDTDGDGDCTDLTSNPPGARRFFYCQDANWNVVALRESTGGSNTIVERYEYDPYGTVRIYRGSASAGGTEQRTVTGQSLKWLDSCLPGNPVMYAGYFNDNETGHADVRRRTYFPEFGCWPQRDPFGYVDGTNLYPYVRSSPTVMLDPLGTCAVLDGPHDALVHYLIGGGTTACLSDRLIALLKKLDFYQQLMLVTIPKAVLSMLPTKCAVSEYADSTSGSLSKVLTAPVQPTDAGDIGIDPEYSWDLNNTIGTINSITWKATCMFGSTKKNKCGCCLSYARDCKVHFTLDDRYTFNTGWKDWLFQKVWGDFFGGEDYDIHNEWDDWIPAQGKKICP